MREAVASSGGEGSVQGLRKLRLDSRGTELRDSMATVRLLVLEMHVSPFATSSPLKTSCSAVCREPFVSVQYSRG